MPCNSDHMMPNQRELDMSRILCFLRELDDLTYPARWLDGYHPEAYDKTLAKDVHDKYTKKLCDKLQGVDVSGYSLELQMWWRDHQAADAKRKEKEEDEDDFHLNYHREYTL